jgi:hypothetical protein
VTITSRVFYVAHEPPSLTDCRSRCRSLDEFVGRIWDVVAGAEVSFVKDVRVKDVRVVPRNGVSAGHVAFTSGRVAPILRGGRLWLDEFAGRIWDVVAGEDVSSSRMCASCCAKASPRGHVAFTSARSHRFSE